MTETATTPRNTSKVRAREAAEKLERATGRNVSVLEMTYPESPHVYVKIDARMVPFDNHRRAAEWIAKLHDAHTFLVEPHASPVVGSTEDGEGSDGE